LTPTDHLVRASMALRGIRPTVADVRAVAADPDALPAIVDRYLRSPEFGATIRELHNETLLLRIQRPEFVPPPLDPIANIPTPQVEDSLFSEPLHLIEDVVMTDQPYTRIVTADYTLADQLVAAVWGLPHSTGPNWERTAWLDGRPAAGILASPALPMRYRSAANNMNRGRANALARGLLCHDFLAGDVQIDPRVDLADPAVVANAVVADPACASCHQTLDPLASYFDPYLTGAAGISQAGALPIDWYYAPERATDWFLTTNRPPSYFGQDAAGLDGLGRAIAADPRFARCAVVHFASYLTQVTERDLPPAWIAQLQEAFVADGFNAKHLARAIVLSDPFRVAYDSDLVAAEGVVGLQQARPAQLSRMLADLTGFQWQGSVGLDNLDDDLEGYRVLAGGIDSFFVTQPVHTTTVTSALVVQRAAFLAATFAVDHDRAAPAADRTLVADPFATDEAPVRAELAALQARIFADLSGDTDATYELFAAALAADGGDARRAWIVTLTGMLSDVKAVTY
jgi:hypothetical protein